MKKCSYKYDGKTIRDRAAVVGRLAKTLASSNTSAELELVNSNITLSEGDKTEMKRIESPEAREPITVEDRLQFLNSITGFVAITRILDSDENINTRSIFDLYKTKLRESINSVTELIEARKLDIEKQPNNARLAVTLGHQKNRLDRLKSMLNNFDILVRDTEVMMRSRLGLDVRVKGTNIAQVYDDGDYQTPDDTDPSEDLSERIISAGREPSYNNWDVFLETGDSNVSVETKLFLASIPVKQYKPGVNFEDLPPKESVMDRDFMYMGHENLYKILRSKMPHIRGTWDEMMTQLYKIAEETKEPHLISFVGWFGSKDGMSNRKSVNKLRDAFIKSKIDNIMSMNADLYESMSPLEKNEQGNMLFQKLKEEYSEKFMAEYKRFKKEFMDFMMSTMASNMSAVQLRVEADASYDQSLHHNILQSNSTAKERNIHSKWAEAHKLSMIFEKSSNFVNKPALNSVIQVLNYMTSNSALLSGDKQIDIRYVGGEPDLTDVVTNYMYRAGLITPTTTPSSVSATELSFSILENLGISLSEATKQHLVKDGLPTSTWSDTPTIVGWLSQYGNAGVFGVIKEKLSEAYNLSDNDSTEMYDKSSGVFDQGVVYNLAKLEARYNETDAPTSHRSGNKTLSEYVTDQPVYDRYMELRTGDVEKLFDSPYSQHSMWLDELYQTRITETGVEHAHTRNAAGEKRYIRSESGVMSGFNIGTPDIDPLKDSRLQQRVATEMSKLPPAKLEIFKLTMFTQGGAFKKLGANSGLYVTNRPDGVIMRKSNMMYQPLGDKDRGVLLNNVPAIYTLFVKDEQNVGNNFKIHDNILEVLYKNVFLSEASRIRATEAKSTRIAGLNDGMQLFFLVPEFNTMKDLWVKDTDTGKMVLADFEQDPVLKNKIKEVLNAHIVKLGQDTMQYWNQIGLVDPTTWDSPDIAPNWYNSFVLSKSGDSLGGGTQFNNAGYSEVAPGSYILNEIGGVEAKELAIKRAAMDYELNSILTAANAHMTMTGDIADFTAGAIQVGKTIIRVNESPNRSIRDRIEDAISRENVSEEIADRLRVNAYNDLVRVTSENMGKRLSADGGPGNMVPIAHDDSDVLFEDRTKMNVLILKDVKLPSLSLSSMPKWMQNAYKNIQVTDGSTLIDWRHNLQIQYAKGRIKKGEALKIARKLRNQEEDIERDGYISRSNILNESELYAIGLLRPSKPMYLGMLFDPESGLNHRVHFKTADITLIPQLTHTTELEKLRRLMVENKIDRTSFTSAVKVGSFREPQSLFDQDGNFVEPVGDIKQSMYENLSYKGFRIQQETPYYDEEAEISRVTQASKLLFVNLLEEVGFKLNPVNFIIENAKDPELREKLKNISEFIERKQDSITGKDLSDIYVQVVDTLVKHEKDRLFKSIFNKDNTINIGYYKGLILDEAIRRGYPLETIKSIQNIKNLKELAYVQNAQSLESLLMSVITKRLINFYMPGQSYVMASDVGMQTNTEMIDIASAKGKDIIANPGIVYIGDYNGGPLKGGIKGEPFQVIVTNDFRDEDGNLIDFLETDLDGNYVWLEKKNNRLYLKDGKITKELFKLYGMRIPNQGHNSQANLEIVGIIPAILGNKIIGPRDIITRMGSDFDIDKLYSYMYFNRVERITKENRQPFAGQIRNLITSLKANGKSGAAVDGILESLNELSRLENAAKENLNPTNKSFRQVIEDMSEDEYLNFVSSAGELGVASFVSKQELLEKVEGLTDGEISKLKGIGIKSFSHPTYNSIENSTVDDGDKWVTGLLKKLVTEYDSDIDDQLDSIYGRLFGQLKRIGNVPALKSFAKKVDEIIKSHPPKIVRYKGTNVSKMLKNIMVDVHHAVAENPSDTVFKEYASPLDAWEFSKGDGTGEDTILHEARRKRGFGQSPASIISGTYQSKKYIDSTSGKALIGKSSLSQTLNATMQIAASNVRRGFTIDALTVNDDNSAEYNPLKMRIGLQEYTPKNSLADPKSLPGEKEQIEKSTVISAEQTVYVDNEKLQAAHKLNFNFQTSSAIDGMVQMGFTDSVARFVSQDIIYDLINRFGVLQYKQNNSFVLAKAYEQIRDEYNKRLEDAGFDRVDEIDYDAPEGSSELTSDRLLDMIENGPPSITNGDEYRRFITAQIHILDKYMFFDALGKELSTYSSALSTDTVGPGTSLLESHVRIENIKKLSASESSDVHPEFGHPSSFVVDGKRTFKINGVSSLFYKHIPMQDPVPTTVQGVMYDHGLKTIEAVTSPVFQFDSELFSNPVHGLFHEYERVAGVNSVSVKTRSDKLKRVYHAFKSLVFSSPGLGLFSNQPILERRSLMTKGYTEAVDMMLMANRFEENILAKHGGKIEIDMNRRLNIGDPLFGATYDKATKTLTMPMIDSSNVDALTTELFNRMLMSQSPTGKLVPDPVKISMLEDALTSGLDYLYQNENPALAEKALLSYINTPGVFGAGDVSAFTDAVKNRSFKGVISSRQKERIDGVLHLRRYFDLMSARMRGAKPVPSALTNISKSPEMTKAVLVPTLFKQFILLSVNNVAGFTNGNIEVPDGENIHDNPRFIEKLFSKFITDPSASAASVKLVGSNVVVPPNLRRKTVSETVMQVQKSLRKPGSPAMYNNHFYKRLSPTLPTKRKNGTYKSAELRLTTSGKTDPIFDTEMSATLLTMLLDGGSTVIKNPDESQDTGYSLGKAHTVEQNAQDMIAWNYLSGGGQFARRFAKYVPYAYLRAVGFFDKLGNLDLSADRTLEMFGIEVRSQITTDNYYRVSRPIKQMVQHFPGQLGTRINRDAAIKIFQELEVTQNAGGAIVNNGVPIKSVYNEKNRVINMDKFYSFEPTDAMELPKKFIRTPEGSVEVWPEFLTYYDYKTRINHLWQYNGKRYVKIFTLGSSGTNSEYDITTDDALPQAPTYSVYETFKYEGDSYASNVTTNSRKESDAIFNSVIYDDKGQPDKNLKNVLEKLVAHPDTDPGNRRLLEFMLSNWEAVSSDKSPIRYEINTVSNKTSAEYFPKDNRLVIHTREGIAITDIDRVMTHELVHALTLHILNNKNLMNENTEIRQRVLELVKLKNLLKTLITSNAFAGSSDPALAKLTNGHFLALTAPGVDPVTLSKEDATLYNIFYMFKRHAGDSTDKAATREAAEFITEILTKPEVHAILAKIDLSDPKIQAIADKGLPPGEISITRPRTMLASFKALFMDLFSSIMKTLGVDPTKNTLLTRSYAAAFDMLHIGLQEKYAMLDGMDAKQARQAASSNLKEYLTPSSKPPVPPPTPPTTPTTGDEDTNDSFGSNADPNSSFHNLMPDVPSNIVQERIKQLKDLGIEDVDAVLRAYANGIENFRDEGSDVEQMVWDLAVSQQRVTENPDIELTDIDISLDDEFSVEAFAFAGVVPLYKDLAVTLSLQNRELNKRLQQLSSEIEMSTDDAEKIELNKAKLVIYSQLDQNKQRRTKISGSMAISVQDVMSEVIHPMLAEARRQIQSGDPGQLVAAKRTIEYVEMLGDFSKPTHQLLTPTQLGLLRKRSDGDQDKSWLEVVLKNIQSGVLEYLGVAAESLINAAATATELRGMLDKRVKTSLSEMVKSSFAYLPEGFVVKDITKDIDLLSKTLLSMDEYSSEVTQAAFDQIKKQLHKGDIEADKLLKDIEGMFSKLSPSEKREMYELFRQSFSNTDDRNTGNMVHPFTAEFQDNLEKILYVINNLGKDVESLRKFGGRGGLIFSKFRQLGQTADSLPLHQYMAAELLLNDASGHAEPGMVTDPANADSSAYYTEQSNRIRNTFNKKFGIKADKMFETHKKRALEMGRKYLADKKAFVQSVMDSDAPDTAKNALIKRWMFENSPFVHAELMRLKGVTNPAQMGSMKVPKTVNTMLQEMGLFTGDINYNNKVLETVTVGFNYSVFVPRESYKKVEGINIKKFTDGVEHITGKTYRELDEDVQNDYYDNKFGRVLNNDAMLEVWEKTLETLETLHKLMPYSMRNKLHGNSLPSISKTIFEKFEGASMRGKVKELVDTLKRSVRDEDKFLQDYTARDVYGDPVDTIGVKYMTFNEQEIKEYVTAKMIVENAKNPIDPNLSEEDRRAIEKSRRENFRREKIHEISQRKTIDLETMLKAYALTANEYHQKVKIEPLMQMAYYFIKNNAKAAQVNSKGEQVVGPGGEPQTSDVRHLAEAFRNNLDAFYNYNLHKKQGVVSGKVLGIDVDKALLTDEDKADRQLLQEALDVLYQALQDQAGVASVADIEAIASNKSHPDYNIARKYVTLSSALKDSEQALIGSKIADGVNILTHFIGIGYNVISAFNNVTFALLAAGIRASKGDIYNENHYNKALKVMLDSAKSFWSFNKHKTPIAIKIRAAMERHRVLKEQKNEIYSSSRKSKAFSFFDRFKNLNPYNLQARGEYFAQGSQFVAILMAHPATLNGETKTLYDFLQDDGGYPANITVTATAYDQETGEKKTYEIQGAEAVELHIKTLVDKVVKGDQGNYDRTAVIGLKREVLLRMFGTFKSWMWESYNTRFAAEHYDYKLAMKKKGRYRSGIGGSLLSSTLLGVPLPLMVSWSKVTNSEGQDVSPLEQSIFATKMLLKKALWGVAGKINSDWEYKDNAWEEFGFSYVDAMNLRANLQECLWHLSLSCVVLLLKYMVADEEDKGFFKATLISMLNIAGRLTADIDFYISISKTTKMINPRNIIPISTHVDDLVKWTEAFTDVMTGDTVFKAGPHKDENKLFVRTMQAIPFVRNIYRQFDLGKMVYDEGMRADIADIRR
jgi:hypothetical protein